MIPGISKWELLSVQKPARYLGGEWNEAVPKPDAALRFCLSFPDLYELGMSNVALKILYGILDQLPQVAVERVFSPWFDFEKLLRTKNIPLFSLETKRPLSEFHILGITLPYEMTFTNVLNILDLGRIPLGWQDRKSGPLIIGGGPSASNPLPMADFFDAILIGDGEEAVVELANTVLRNPGCTQNELREAISQIEGFWVPAFPKNVKRRVFTGFGDFPPPLKLLVSSVETIQDRIPLEIFRGCIQGCRFCQAGFFYRPKRERSPEKLVEWAKEIAVNTGDESLGLISLSTSDYSCLSNLLEELSEKMPFPEQVISVPSLRMNDNTLTLLEKTSKIRKSGLTFAPEAGSQRMRSIIKKNITFEEIKNVFIATKNSPYRAIKLYFMIGLPFETSEDLDAIVALVKELEYLSKKEGIRKDVSVSISGFVPKPFTPFQWCPQIGMEELRQRRLQVCRGLSKCRAKISWRDEKLFRLEGAISRGDQKLGKVILAAFKKGSRFDGWNEHFNAQNWDEAFLETGVDPGEYVKERSLQESLPLDFIDFRVPRDFLENEFNAAQKLATGII